jgi:hypothetical protein
MVTRLRRVRRRASLISASMFGAVRSSWASTIVTKPVLSWQVRNHPDDFLPSIPITTSELHQLASATKNRRLLGRACNGDPSTPPELQQSFIPQEPEGAKDCVRVDTEDSRQVLCRWEAFSRPRFTFCDGAADFGCHLIVQGDVLVSVDLDT